MLIEFSMHSLEKIGLLKSHGIAVSKELKEVQSCKRYRSSYSLRRMQMTALAFGARYFRAPPQTLLKALPLL